MAASYYTDEKPAGPAVDKAGGSFGTVRRGQHPQAGGQTRAGQTWLPARTLRSGRRRVWSLANNRATVEHPQQRSTAQLDLWRRRLVNLKTTQPLGAVLRLRSAFDRPCLLKGHESA